MDYRDFNIRILSKTDEGFEVSVDSPGGDASETITLPFSVEEALNKLREMGGTVRGGNGGTREVEFDGSQTVTPADMGGELYKSLFAGSIRRMYDRSHAKLLDDPDVGLRIKLHLNLEDPEVAELAQLPWEFVYEEETMEYLTLSRQTPIVRYIEVPRSLNSQRIDGDLRILVVMASPKGVAALDLEKERNQIAESWAGEENISVDFLEHPTSETLLDALTNQRYHVLHYMGHGAYDPNTSAGALILEDDQGEPFMLDPQTLGTYLRDAPTVRLVFLNACDTARSGDEEPFAGVANRLVMAGVPAVLAMQFPITDDAAIDFSHAFYKRLVQGNPVDECTAQGRKAILAGRSGTIEWGTPVLYMRAPDGMLFDGLSNSQSTSAPATDGTPPVQKPPPQPAPVGGSATPVSNIPKIIAAVAAIVIVALAWKFWPGDDKFQFADDTIKAAVGKEIQVKIGMLEEDGSLDFYDESYTIEIPPTEQFTVIPPSDEDKLWEWRITVGDLDAPENADEDALVTSGTVEFEARIRERESNEIVEFLEGRIDVSVDKTARDALTLALSTFEDPDTSIEKCVEDYKAAIVLDAQMSGSMKNELAKAYNLFMSDLTENAWSEGQDKDLLLDDRIVAVEDWQYATEETRQNPAIGELMDYKADLEGLQIFERLVVCNTKPGCADASMASQRAGENNIFIWTEPEVRGLQCEFVSASGSANRPCGDRINTGQSRYVHTPGEYELQVRNREGDLLAVHDFTATN